MAALVGVSSLSALATAEAGDGRPPNVIVIMADDLGYECIGANGGTSHKTPVLDRLAAEGIRFEHCYSQPLCTPSRVQIMTGIYNVRNYVRFGLLDPKQTTFANLLQEAGYATCVAGKWQLKGGFEGPGRFGFDEYCLWQLTRRPGRYPNPGLEMNGRQVDFTDGQYGPDVVTDYICDFVTRNRDRPFLVYYPMILTHCPFEPTPDSPEWDPKSKGSQGYKGNPKYFAHMVQYMDKLIGRIVASLDEHGLRKSTMVIFTTDNGTDRPVVSMMGDRKVKAGKGSMSDNGTRVPLIANWPGTIPPGQVSKDLVDFTDFLPTICEATGVLVPEKLEIDGRSFLPRLKSEPGNPREWIYCWYSRGGQADKARVFARNQRYKLFGDGRFLDMADGYQPQPLDVTRLTGTAAKDYRLLKSVLDKYEDARPEGLR
jgi:arylsulfatase A